MHQDTFPALKSKFPQFSSFNPNIWDPSLFQRPIYFSILDIKSLEQIARMIIACLFFINLDYLQHFSIFILIDKIEEID